MGGGGRGGGGVGGGGGGGGGVGGGGGDKGKEKLYWETLMNSFIQNANLTCSNRRDADRFSWSTKVTLRWRGWGRE